jgi:hypothetical protein
MKQDFEAGNMTAFEHTIDMKPKSFYSNPFQALTNIIDDQDDNHDECFHSQQILRSRYDKSDVKSVAQHQTHLSQAQRNELHLLFTQHTKLFSGTLGHYTVPTQKDAPRTSTQCYSKAFKTISNTPQPTRSIQDQT